MRLAIRQIGVTLSREEVRLLPRSSRRPGLNFVQQRVPRERLPPSPEALRFAALRAELGLTVLQGARALGLRSEELEALERGEAIPEAVDGWALAEQGLREMGEKVAAYRRAHS